MKTKQVEILEAEIKSLKAVISLQKEALDRWADAFPEPKGTERFVLINEAVKPKILR